MKQSFIRTSTGVILQTTIMAAILAWSGGCSSDPEPASEEVSQPQEVASEEANNPITPEMQEPPQSASQAADRYDAYSETADRVTEENQRQTQKVEEYFE